MTIAPVARISRILFTTNASDSKAMIVPLGIMLEGVYPEDARWLGLVGRTRLTPQEQSAINMRTWQELAKPFEFLKKLFDNAWLADWGKAGLTLESQWARSAIRITSEDLLGVLPAMDTPAHDSALKVGEALLNARLMSERGFLAPAKNPHSGTQIDVGPQLALHGIMPTASITQQDMLEAA